MNTYSFSRSMAMTTFSMGRARFMRMWCAPWKGRYRPATQHPPRTRPFYLIQRVAAAPTVFLAVQKQHIGALRLLHADSRQILADKLAGVLDVLRQHLPQLIHPLAALVAVSADEGVHGQHVHAVVVAEAALLLHPFVESFVIHDVIAADEPRQIEGLGGGVQGHGALSGVVGHGLQGGYADGHEGSGPTRSRRRSPLRSVVGPCP